MSTQHASLAATLLVIFASSAHPQAPPTSQKPDPVADFSVQVWGDAASDFSARVSAYLELRRSLEKGLPPLVITTNPDEIELAESLLAERIRIARARAKRGEIFTRPITRAFKSVLAIEIDRSTWWSIMDDNPGEFDRKLNGRYPKTKPLSTMPPNILAVLPVLSGDLEFRFVGHDLILRDGRANVIIDVMEHAITCKDCE